MRNFTPEELIQYYYHEMPLSTAGLVQERMRTDWTLAEKLDVIAEAAERLDRSLNCPSRRSMTSILDYAAQQKVRVFDDSSALTGQ